LKNVTLETSILWRENLNSQIYPVALTEKARNLANFTDNAAKTKVCVSSGFSKM